MDTCCSFIVGNGLIVSATRHFVFQLPKNSNSLFAGRTTRGFAEEDTLAVGVNHGFTEMAGDCSDFRFFGGKRGQCSPARNPGRELGVQHGRRGLPAAHRDDRPQPPGETFPLAYFF